MTIEIETGVPIPPPKGGCGRPHRYPFAGMNVGDSFAVPRVRGEKRECGSDRVQARISNAAGRWVRRHKSQARFVVRVIDETTVRCWRIK